MDKFLYYLGIPNALIIYLITFSKINHFDKLGLNCTIFGAFNVVMLVLATFFAVGYYLIGFLIQGLL